MISYHRRGYATKRAASLAGRVLTQKCCAYRAPAHRLIKVALGVKASSSSTVITVHQRTVSVAVARHCQHLWAAGVTTRCWCTCWHESTIKQNEEQRSERTWLRDEMKRSYEHYQPISQGEPAKIPRSRDNSKQAQVLAMLRRPEGATIAQICEETGWQSHTVRGTFAGSFKKKLGLVITSIKEAGSQGCYRIAD